MNIGLTVLLLLLFLDIASGQFQRPTGDNRKTVMVNLLNIGITYGVRALMLVLVGAGLAAFFPQWKGGLSDAPVVPVFLAALAIDDCANYWLHRQAHHRPFLWRLHKPHHTPTNINVLMASRENVLYYFLVPVIWMAPVLLYLGAEQAAALLFALKAIVVYLQHAGYRWDLWLRRFKPGRLLLTAAESVISLQHFHHIHHGIGRFGNASSNYGNVLCIWDRLHGTVTWHEHGPQDAYGVPAGVPLEPWAVQLMWPLVRDKKTAPPVLATPLQASSAAELAAAPAVIVTATGVAVAVRMD